MTLKEGDSVSVPANNVEGTIDKTSTAPGEAIIRLGQDDKWYFANDAVLV